jgi:preprotein translocase subunit Sec61beta
VLWAFFGIRKRKDYDSDAVRLTPGQVIVAGIIGAVLVVLTLVLVVRFVTG